MGLPYTVEPVETDLFYPDDLVIRKDFPSALGVVDRTTGDVNTQTPNPQLEYDHAITRHKDIPQPKFSRFLKDGIPPQSTVLVEWVNSPGSSELIPCKHLLLIHREIMFGDRVKKSPEDTMTGTVVNTAVKCSLARKTWIDPEGTVQFFSVPGFLTLSAPGPLQIGHEIALDVPSEELISMHHWHEGSLVLFQDFLGRIEQVVDQITVRLQNGTVVVPDRPSEIVTPQNTPLGRFEIGSHIQVHKTNLRRGKWIVGAYDPNAAPRGTVIGHQTVELRVIWISRRIHGPSYRPEPPSLIGLRDLESGLVRQYDRTRYPKNNSNVGRNTELWMGYCVRFNDEAAAALKYDGSKITKRFDGSEHRNHIVPRTHSGFNMNIYEIKSLTSTVTVQWQDLSTSTLRSTELIPENNIDDTNDTFPGEIVVSNEYKKDTDPGIVEPSRVGVVQSVDNAERLARVRWAVGASLKYMDVSDTGDLYTGNVLPGSTTGIPVSDSLPVENISLYDVRSPGVFAKRRGDFVILHPPPESGLNQSEELMDWFGEIVDIKLDGMLVVRLGALEEVRDVELAPEFVMFVIPSDMNLSGIEPGLDDEDGSDDSHLGDTIMSGEWHDVDGLGYIISIRPGLIFDSIFPPNSDEDDPDDPDDEWSTEESDLETGYDDDVMDWDSVNTESERGVDASEPSTVNPPANDVQPDAAKPMEPPSLEEDHTMGETLTPTVEGAPAAFEVLESPPPDSHFYVSNADFKLSTQLMRRVAKEHRILQSSLPEGIFVRTYESRLDLLRVLIVGPLDTPYEFAPFLIDFCLTPQYPQESPLAYFHSWTNGTGPVNPNMYENGKICLSLLGTWHADERNESWSPARSTVLQILVSILGLVLVKEPFYNEAGYEVRAGSADAVVPSARYSEATYLKSRKFITHALRNPIPGFEDVVNWLYLDRREGAPRLLDRAIAAAKEIIEVGERSGGAEVKTRGGLTRVTKGGMVILQRELAGLEALRPTTAEE
ncbi:hypothetical protein EJ06DRAFT_557347 [Trichodelitschia bisporula]|uniref:UBC core domain-containing protein n=1 Tax=Trichodelitschia bisporula TaxID=703511 RepID=A0A6G1HUM8_9PEZI|nr:hypothetical protein EJ06DRAFT_557347 [Trichodelitschia bisporula]